MSPRRLGRFVGVQWGWPTQRGRQSVHIITGPAPEPERGPVLGLLHCLCGTRPSAGAVYPYTSHGRPMVTCRACRRAAAAHLNEMPTGETPAARWP